MPTRNARWSRQFHRCVQCNTTDRPHFGGGLCRKCYMDAYNVTHSCAIKASKRRWYDRAGGAEWSKIQREQRNYDGQREAVLTRDGFACIQCGSTQHLCVHHKDKRGRSVPRHLKNNAIDNLETLCRKCHINAHRADLLAVRRANNFRRPSGLTYRNSRR